MAERHRIPVVVVANKWMNLPLSPLIEMKVVS
ncbi:MAG TPA: hypothetical protein PL182_04130, partial [Pseudobdellovibrionaceae bacterium]|nr:hypothetical protein [Pseudobdellovibrionaceae bacterium]